jgi:hypothetical protein
MQMMRGVTFKRIGKNIINLVVLVFCMEGGAQEKRAYRFINARELTVLGQSAAVRQREFHRVDTADQKLLPRRVAELSRHSAGISILFETDARSIRVQWVLGKYNTLWNMTPLAVNGMDLYAFNGTSWQYVAAARPVADSNDVVMISHLDGARRRYRLYLPLYSEAKEVQVGVDSGAVISGVPLQPRPKVVIYGSSITQGASASRPGMAYPAILGRQLEAEVYNLGFSGSGKMELAVTDVLAKMEADVYVLDCVPNPSAAEIRERALPFVRRLRTLRPGVPIIMVESLFREDAWWDSEKRASVTAQNGAFRAAYEQLKSEKWKGLYYLQAERLTGTDHEATIDGTHLTDVGFQRMAAAVGRALREALR